ncbi:hypothetical protein HO173_011351 [Letharia columbiana]|uniref:Uncharacterized protein n=1 Tax=Letharia columbiana TaxID=112416 RepID=A0A8H6FJH7_9LECA|nr:uncharacterized protein HO173_011351 [Letharia columbiana]KAF6229705.1 hypothetical protein HO173_011351 [Letharia columbiana]
MLGSFLRHGLSREEAESEAALEMARYHSYGYQSYFPLLDYNAQGALALEGGN